MQKGLDSTWKWRGDNYIDYHLTGPKRPFYYLFRKTGTEPLEEGHVKLYMGDTCIERAYEKVQLGIRIKVAQDNHASNRYGYELIWRGKEPLARTAYRLQDMMFTWDPKFIRTCVQSYVIGKLQYAAALYWLRGTPDSRTRARFDYTMSMAAICGLSAPEIVGKVSCGGAPSVK